MLLFESGFQFRHACAQHAIQFLKRLDFLLGLNPGMAIAKLIFIDIREQQRGPGRGHPQMRTVIAIGALKALWSLLIASHNLADRPLRE